MKLIGGVEGLLGMALGLGCGGQIDPGNLPSIGQARDRSIEGGDLRGDLVAIAIGSKRTLAPVRNPDHPEVLFSIAAGSSGQLQ